MRSLWDGSCWMFFVIENAILWNCKGSIQFCLCIILSTIHFRCALRHWFYRLFEILNRFPLLKQRMVIVSFYILSSDKEDLYNIFLLSLNLVYFLSSEIEDSNSIISFCFAMFLSVLCAEYFRNYFNLFNFPPATWYIFPGFF